MPLIAVLSLVLLFLGHSTLAGITGLIFALLFLAGFRHEKRILVLCMAADVANMRASITNISQVL